jgi:hypothetical protein
LPRDSSSRDPEEGECEQSRGGREVPELCGDALCQHPGYELGCPEERFADRQEEEGSDRGRDSTASAQETSYENAHAEPSDHFGKPRNARTKNGCTE